ncbi:MAG: UDP-N-acetylmuramoyl-L-alanyl-D-glutamate--2,6-diaminopimelate ligase [Alistipes sp.]|nr:UDP-N-acetylmuramoyl-L-alanyl-D-glutamate--2,6-diaminopimelate ligase [Candidatus Alistipes equi]
MYNVKKLNQLIKDIKIKEIIGNSERIVSGLSLDSRNIDKGYCFFAVSGTKQDGHLFAKDAIKRGATTILCQHPLEEEENNKDITQIVVEDTQAAMALMAEAFYDYPSRKMKVVGVTGTNGKTTIATLLYDLVRKLGYKAGLISTVIYKIDERSITSTHTTPDAIRLSSMMNEMVQAGCTFCFMECSSHAISQSRIDGINFDGALYTNLTHDHLDYHHTYQEYIKAKKRFFDILSPQAFALVNQDDKNGMVMLQNTKAKKYTLALKSLADFNCKILEEIPEGMLLKIDGQEVWTKLIGRFNAYNILTIYATALLLGFDKSSVLQVISTLNAVNGRMENCISPNGIRAVIDYAHTPDALENVLLTLREIRKKEERIITICGCGGDRDKTKRPEMAHIAQEMSDMVILTSDNPRTENAEDIIRDMEAGLKNKDSYLRISDREMAIKTAITLAKPKDIILIAGKGHEDYQIIGTEKFHFSDKECVEKYFSLIKA